MPPELVFDTGFGELLATPEAQARMDEGIFKLVGAIYELDTGRVHFLD